MTETYDVAVIGAGIVGLAHAWMAARQGLRVIVLERSPRAQGASIRNFGMVWPIGQPAGELHRLALRARIFWLELDAQRVLDVEQCGSIHLAHHPDELAVLEEFADQQTHECRLLRPEDVVQRTRLANPTGLLGGLWSPTECRVDPRTASSRIAAWLSETAQVDVRFSAPVTGIENRTVRTAGGDRYRAERIIVCSGSDLRTLYADILEQSELTLCKLQMLKTVAQPSFQNAAPHIASGLTLRHYTAFANCPSLPRLRNRIAEQTPELDRYGIHVMASQTEAGELILGDSHEYGSDITPFDQAEIDDLILRELRKVLQLEDWTIQERWHGVYAKHPRLPVFETEADDGTRIFVGTGGAGMTLSFGLAERSWKRWLESDS